MLVICLLCLASASDFEWAEHGALCTSWGGRHAFGALPSRCGATPKATLASESGKGLCKQLGIRLGSDDKFARNFVVKLALKLVRNQIEQPLGERFVNWNQFLMSFDSLICETVMKANIQGFDVRINFFQGSDMVGAVQSQGKFRCLPETADERYSRALYLHHIPTVMSG